MVGQARSEAKREWHILTEQACQEAQKIVARAEVMKSAAQEELEAQRLYTEAARLKAESHEILAMVGGVLREIPAPKENGTNGHKPDHNGTEEINHMVEVQPTEQSEAPAQGVAVKAHRRRSSKPKKSA